MSVSDKHYGYEEAARIWKLMRDSHDGELAIKDASEEYLIKPTGFQGQSDGGTLMYKAYVKRAQYPDILQPTLQGMVGVIHRIEANISGLEEGKPLAMMWETATKEGLPLEAFHRQLTTELLLTGRYSILTDVSSEAQVGRDIPYLAGYSAEQLLNWSNVEKDLFVLDESRKVHSPDDEFAWIDKKSYRVLRFKDGVYSQQVYDEENNAEDEINPNARGNKPLKEIPFVTVGPRFLTLEVEQPPLYGVAKAALAIYQLDADYRFQMHNTGQETLVVIGEVESLPRIVGAGVVIGLPAGSDAKYVSPSGVGIEKLRQAIMDERQNAVAAGVKLFDDKGQAESGEALRIRGAAQTATLMTIAMASASALERALRYAAQFVGQDPTEIVVKPNLKFVDTAMAAAEAVQLVSVWMQGAISKLTLYENLQKGEIASAERTFEEEQDLIDQEAIDNPVNDDPNAQLDGGGQGQPQLQLPAPSSRFVEDGEGLEIVDSEDYIEA